MKANAGCGFMIWIFKAAFVLEGSSEVMIIYISGKSGFSASTPLSLSTLRTLYSVLLHQL